MPLLPALSHYFGLHPPGLWNLTADELEPYLEQLEAIQRGRG